MNRVRFTGHTGGRTLGAGTYAVTAHPAGQAQRTRRVVVTIVPRKGTLARQEFDCSSSIESTFFGGAPFFADDPGPTTAGSAKSAPRAKKDKGSGGVLPAITRKIRRLPEAIPRPPLPGADSPPMLLGLAALALLVLSGAAILAYVIRFLRRPHASM